MTAVDPYAVLGKNRLLQYWSWHTGALLTARLAEMHVRKEVGDRSFDAAFVDNGEIISPDTVEFLRQRGGKVLLFNRDNPFVTRDGMRWRTLLAALPKYDLYATPRQSTADRARDFGARSVLRVNFFADEILHTPMPPTPEEYSRYKSPVSFVGSWFPERGPFMETLIKRGVPLKIIGNRWHKSQNFYKLKDHLIAGYLTSTEYSAAVRSSNIAICMLSKGNEDLQTSRSSEIPAMGVVLCAERTSEHEAMYKEGEEALFWSTADECANMCLTLLANPSRLAAIAQAGRARVLRNDSWTESTMERILRARPKIGLPPGK